MPSSPKINQVSSLGDMDSSPGQDHPEFSGRTMSFSELFLRQVISLIYKNFLVAVRNRVSFAVRILSSIVWLLIAFILISALNSITASQEWRQDVPSPPSSAITGIPAPTGGVRAFVYTPAPRDLFDPSASAISASDYADAVADAKLAEHSRIHEVVRAVMSGNKGHTLQSRDVLGFESVWSMQSWMSVNQDQAGGGVELFSPSEQSGTNFVLHLNSSIPTAVDWSLGPTGPPEEGMVASRAMPMQVEFTRAIGELALGRKLDIQVSVQRYAHPSPTEDSQLLSQLEKLLLPTFIVISLAFPLTTQVGDIVGERETKVLQAMTSMGLLHSAYWVSWHVFHALINLTYAFLFTVVGIIFKYQAFFETNFLVMWLTIFWYSLAIQGISYFSAALITKQKYSTTIGGIFMFFSLVSTVLVQLGIPYDVPFETFTPTWIKSDKNFYTECVAGAFQHVSDGTFIPCDSGLGNCNDANIPLNHVLDRRPCSAVLANNTNYTRAFVDVEGGGWQKKLAGGLSVLPPVLFTKCVTDMVNAADNDTWGFGPGHYGIGLHNMSSYCSYNSTTPTTCDPVYGVGSAWGIFFGIYLLFSALGLYLTHVLPDYVTGVRLEPWYFLTPTYWGYGSYSISQQPAQVIEASEDEDVIEEERIMAQRAGQPMDPTSAIEIRGILMRFQGLFQRAKPFDAVKCPQFAIKKNSLFCLLGPNGAGKTTTINVLTGILPPTSGEALIYGETVTHPSGMAKIRQIMGVCPQFDILWPVLTAKEHMEVFGAIKGLPRPVAASDGIKKLEEVRLTEDMNNYAGSYSGGMKRRLSCAIALLGNPKIIFLDEPTTGMDPVSRRQVWDVIESVKRERCVVLTTHSMEEADILGDTIGIMAKGRLRCIGNSVHLKSKFGAGYEITVMAPTASLPQIKKLFDDEFRPSDPRSSSIQVLGESDHLVSFRIPIDMEDRLVGFFDVFDGRKDDLGVTGTKVSMSSLEDVFIKIAKDAEEQAAGEKTIQIKSPSGLECDIKIGNEEVQTAGNERFKVVWGIDDNGQLSALETVPVSASPAVSTESAQASLGFVSAPTEAQGAEEIQSDQSPEDGASIKIEVRKKALETSPGTQFKAIMYKTLMTQYQRKGAVGAILVTPIIFLLLILLGQGISEMLDGPRLPTTRCTYCGPSNDDFGKAYCAGQECVDLFIPEYRIPPKGSKPYLDRDRRFGCNQTSPQCHQEAIATVNREREECRAIATVCGGGGNYSCFFPDATATISNEYSFDISRGVVKTCDFFEFRRLADNTTRAASAPNTNPLPFPYAPLELAARPIAYSSDGGDTAQQSEIVRRSLGSGLPSNAISASIQATLSSLFTLAALPGIGCGQTTNNDTLISLDTSPAWAALCGLLQHGHTSQAPCCLDVTDSSHTWTDSLGTVSSSGEGLTRVNALITKVFGGVFASAYSAQAISGKSIPFTCVRPEYPTGLAARMPVTSKVGIEEGLAIIAQYFNLSSSTHPIPDASTVPSCTAWGNCTTPNARWAQSCDEALALNGVSQEARAVPCGGNGQLPCSFEWAVGAGAKLPCMCKFKEFAARYAQMELGIVAPSLYGGLTVSGNPKLPETTPLEPLRPFGWPGVRAMSHAMEPSRGAGEQLPWWKPDMYLMGNSPQGDAQHWWTMNVRQRYEEPCICTTTDGKGSVCDNYDDERCKTGSDKEEDCPCLCRQAAPSNRSIQLGGPRGDDASSRGSTGDRQSQGTCRGTTAQMDTAAWSILVSDCNSQDTKDAMHLIHRFANITDLKVGCVTAATQAVQDHDALNRLVYNGFYRSKASSAKVGGETVEGIASAFDLGGTSGDTLRLNLMINVSSADTSRWARYDRSISQLNELLSGFIGDRLAAASKAWNGANLIGLKGMPGTPPWGSLYFTVDNTMSATLMTISLSQILSNVVLALVEDTAQNIRVMMRMSGLKSWAYWAASFSMWFCIAMTQSAIFLFFAKIVSLPSGWKMGLLQTTDDSVTFVLVVLAQLNIVSFSFFFSSLLGSIKSALTWGTVFNMTRYFILGQISDVFTSTTIPEWIKSILSLLPPVGVFRATVSMTQYNLKSVDPLIDSSSTLGWDSVIAGRSPVGEIILILLFEIPVFLFLAFWIDQVYGMNGAPKHPLFFLGFSRDAGLEKSQSDVEAVGADDGDPEDVTAEVNRIQGAREVTTMASALQAHDSDAVVIRGLRKVYPGKQPKVAVRNLTMGIRRGECFGMLGPNGAGKTTTINMLSGYFKPTMGDATIEGHSISSEMDKIYSIAGVCPQHDVLWGILTPRNHLRFYGRLKNLEGKVLDDAVNEALVAVNLLDKIDSAVETFSGGMKRRLSVAISLIGSPIICYLDEPSTGLDPASRRLLWKAIKNANKTRTILLTTHSMEEAEGLCDRMGIFVGGRLRCIGAPQELTMRLGGTLILTMTTAAGAGDQVHEWVDSAIRGVCPNATCTYRLDRTHKYELPADKTSLGKIFLMTQRARAEGKIVSSGVSSSTLEDVFIKIATGRH